MENFVIIRFLGACGVVTGSKILIETSEKKILIDCGMFQGLKELRELNWKGLPVDAESIDVVLLTHGHLDHVGYLPRLVKQGFRGKIIGTAATLEIAKIILNDSAKIHEEEAKRSNKEKFTKHDPALPYYTLENALNTIQLFQDKTEGEWIRLSDHISYRFQYIGHIIGAVFIELKINGKRLVFSGDIGRADDYLLYDPKKPQWADFLFMESTYGNKLHPKEDVYTELKELISETVRNQGNLIIPSFAVERSQTLMYILWKLHKENEIPHIPIFVDSPMGNNVLEIFKRFPKLNKLSTEEFNEMCKHINIVTSYKETWQVINNKIPKIVVAGSGMVTGGRVLTYLKHLIDKPSTTILLVGYQAEGTRGRQLKEGTNEIKFFGKYHSVKASIKSSESLSAHADQYELLNWMKNIKNTPEKVFLVHGEPIALDAFRLKIKDTYHWTVQIPKLNTIEIIKV
jgi:metallo-beta-lactamase family protein